MPLLTNWKQPLLSVAGGLLALSLVGCYGPTKTLPEPRAFVPDGVPEAPPPKPAPVAAKPAVVETARTPEPPEPPPELKRPAAVAQWTHEDLLAARHEGDPMLPAAVAHFLKTSSRDANTARVAALLLTSEQAAAEGPSTASRHAMSSPGIYANMSLSLLDYLVESDEPIAQQTIEDVLRGKGQVDFNWQQAARLVLKGWLRKEVKYYEPLYQQILEDPVRWRSAEDPHLNADSLQQIALEIIRPVASPALRQQLALHLVKPETPASHRERLGPWLAEEKPENLAARVVLHNSDLLNQSARLKFRQSFAPLNAAAFDALLQITPALHLPASVTSSADSRGSSEELFQAASPSHLVGGDERTADDAGAWELAAMFWSDTFAASVADDVSQMADIGRQRDLMLLACNLPHNAVRRELRRALDRQWTEGVAPFETARLTFDSIRDPGFLPLVKLMPREEPKPAAAQRPATRTAATVKPSQEQEAKYAWMMASEQFVRTLNTRFYTAARSGNQSVRATRGTADKVATLASVPEDRLPLELPRAMETTAEYHLNWPAEVPSYAGVRPGPLVIHYVRMEGEDRISRAADHFKRQLHGSATRTTVHGHWVDFLSDDPVTRRVRSVDVMITREGAPPRISSTPEKLVIELLWVEVADPS